MTPYRRVFSRDLATCDSLEMILYILGVSKCTVSSPVGSVLHKREYAAGGAWKTPHRNLLLGTRKISLDL
jgi:hypothetical protein